MYLILSFSIHLVFRSINIDVIVFRFNLCRVMQPLTPSFKEVLDSLYQQRSHLGFPIVFTNLRRERSFRVA